MLCSYTNYKAALVCYVFLISTHKNMYSHIGQWGATSTLCPWNTMEYSQPAAWKTNRSLLVASHDEAFPEKLTNSDSTLPRAVQLEGGVIRRHWCITSHSRSAQASPDMQPTPALSHMHTIDHLHRCPNQTHHSHDQLHTCTNCD